jgi:hypothetical protein
MRLPKHLRHMDVEHNTRMYKMGKRKSFPGLPGAEREERSTRVKDVISKVSAGFYFGTDTIDEVAETMSFTILDCVFR